MVSLELLVRYPYFAGVCTESLRIIAEISSEQHFQAGHTLFREGASARYLYVLQRGEIDILYDVSGGKTRVVETVVPSNLLCWSAIVEPHRTTASAVIRVDSDLLCLQGPRLSTLCKQDPDLGYRLMTHVARTISRRLKAARLQLATKAEARTPTNDS